jgi:Ras-related protein Rab-18
VYDVTNKESFQNIKHWLNEVELYSTNDDVIKMLVANKIDLCENDSTARQVSRSEGASFARQNGMLFIEASAKTQIGVKDAFNELCSKVLDRPSLVGSSKSSTQQQNAGLRLTEESGSAGRGCTSCVTG